MYCSSTYRLERQHDRQVLRINLHYSDVIMSAMASNHRRLDYLLGRFFRCTSKKTSKLRVTGLCEGKPPVTDGFVSQRASNAEDISIWWRHHGLVGCYIVSGWPSAEPMTTFCQPALHNLQWNLSGNGKLSFKEVQFKMSSAICHSMYTILT